jgi:hypothetical protein
LAAKSQDCARVLYFENESDEFPYSSGGSCFLASYRGDLFVITADHVLKDRSPDDVCVFARRGEREFLPLEWHFHPDVPREGHRDFAIFKVRDGLEAQLAAPDALDLTEAFMENGRLPILNQRGRLLSPNTEMRPLMNT